MNMFGNLPLDWNVEVGNVAKGKVDKLLEVVLTQMVLKALPSELLAFLHCEQTVFGEAVDAFINNILANLFGNFHDIRARDNSAMNSLSHGGVQSLNHIRLDALSSRRQRLVHIEQCNHSLLSVHFSCCFFLTIYFIKSSTQTLNELKIHPTHPNVNLNN